MATQRRKTEQPEAPRRPLATTPQDREDQLINAALDLVERKLQTGEATSQEIVHFLKLGSSREKIEQERLKMELSLGQARIEAMQSAHRIEELMSEAIDAFRSYSGGGSGDNAFDD